MYQQPAHISPIELRGSACQGHCRPEAFLRSIAQYACRWSTVIAEIVFDSATSWSSGSIYDLHGRLGTVPSRSLMTSHSAAGRVAAVRLVGVESRDGQHFSDTGRGSGDVRPVEVCVGAQAPRPVIPPLVVRAAGKAYASDPCGTVMLTSNVPGCSRGSIQAAGFGSLWMLGPLAARGPDMLVVPSLVLGAGHAALRQRADSMQV
jgi:hypothetical protein